MPRQRQTRRSGTIERVFVAISHVHELHGFPFPRKAPEATEVLQGIRRTLGVAPNQKDPVLVDTLRALAYAFDPARNAMLVLGGEKTGDDRFYRWFIPQAKGVWEQYLKEQGVKP